MSNPGTLYIQSNDSSLQSLCFSRNHDLGKNPQIKGQTTKRICEKCESLNLPFRLLNPTLVILILDPKLFFHAFIPAC